MNKLNWKSLSLSEKRLLSNVCPECLCGMSEYILLEGWQKCASCGYTRENPSEALDGYKQFDLIAKSK